MIGRFLSRKGVRAIKSLRYAPFCVLRIKPARFYSKTIIQPLIARSFRMFCSQKTVKLPRGQRQVAAWLFFSATMVAIMVLLGGITRLTRSGLSMTSWKFLGEEYPKNEDMWEEEFKKYKEYPEYKRINSSMVLSEFKRIYFMEYLHRMWGRALGLVFTIPLGYFAARGFLTRPIKNKLSLLFLMGGSQGLIGWWMVKSGLDEKPSTHMDLPRVSPYRLSLHLVSAFAIYLLLLKTALNCVDNHLLSKGKMSTFVAQNPMFRKISITAASLVLLTVISGSFVAGTEAGMVYNQFPWMGEKGRLIPTDYIDKNIKPIYLNLFENPSAVQFNHRLLGSLSALSCTGLWLFSLTQRLSKVSRILSISAVTMSVLQASLGAVTLVKGVPIDLAATHQSGALVLLTILFALSHFGNPKRLILAKIFKTK